MIEANAWISHDGFARPPATAFVDVKFRDGTEMLNCVAGLWNWKPSGDIVAWRLHRSAQTLVEQAKLLTEERDALADALRNLLVSARDQRKGYPGRYLHEDWGTTEQRAVMALGRVGIVLED